MADWSKGPLETLTQTDLDMQEVVCQGVPNRCGIPLQACTHAPAPHALRMSYFLSSFNSFVFSLCNYFNSSRVVSLKGHCSTQLFHL